MRFEWDETKAASNLRKHKVSFATAARVFLDPYHMTSQDRVEGNEYRWQTIGQVGSMTLYFVAHTHREEGGEDIIRIISARLAERPERRRYEQAREV